MSTPIYIFVLHIDKLVVIIIMGSMVRITPKPIIDKYGRATQQEIAKSLGVSRPTVSNWLSGNMKAVDLEMLDRFAKACGVEVAAFFEVVNE